MADGQPAAILASDIQARTGTIYPPPDSAAIAGRVNGHELVNRFANQVVILEVGTRSEGDRVHYPEADMAAVKESGKYRLTRKDGTPF
jgi:uncharacterized cupin superfamily protein